MRRLSQRRSQEWVCLHALALSLTCLMSFAMALAAPSRVLAAEAGQSTYLKGYQDFLSGVIPPESGVYIRNDLLFYDASIDRTVIGGRVAASLHLQLTADLLSVNYVTPLKILGGTYVLGAALSAENVNASADAQGARFGISQREDRFSLGDSFFTPALLAWTAGNFHWTAAFSFGAPTGIYHNNSLSNTSLNRWSFMPQAAITYLDPKTGWNASVAAIFVASTQNPATHYQTGDLAHVDFSAGRFLSKAFQLGIVGYYEQQLTADSGEGAVLGPNKARVWALGPGATYTFAVSGKPVTATAKWTHEFAAQNTFHGQTVTVAAAFKF